MTSETTSGREVVQIVEIKQPFCGLAFGVSPCTATGTADTKCYNTSTTCQDIDNYDASTLSLFFANGDVASRGVSGAPYVLPMLVSVSTTPTQINLAGSSQDAAGLGTRALCTVVMSDQQHTDHLVDPYVDGRSWNPLDKERGTFWQRWMARNKYRQNMQVIVYEGYKGQALSAMTKRTYFMEGVPTRSSNGRVTIKAKDIFAKAEERKAQAPAASSGILGAAIDSTATSMTINSTEDGDYPAPGVVKIGSEIIRHTGSSYSSGVTTLTGCTRGTFRTTAASHDVEAAVQRCLEYSEQRADDIVEDLLTTYAGIDAAWLDTTNWASEFDVYSAFYILDALITEPTAVATLVSELMVQVGVYIFWDERDALVKWKAIRGIDVLPDLLTDDTHILDGFVIEEMPRQRVSQVWIYYDKTDYLADLTDTSAYDQQFVPADLQSEGDLFYGEASIRKIYSRWLSARNLAQTSAERIITRYVDTPSKCTFHMDAKDRSYWVGDTVRISHFMDRDQYGARRVRNWTITSAEETEPGHKVKYTAEDTTLYGRINFIMADDADDYDPAVEPPFKNCYIGDDEGLLSDGTPSARIA